MLIIIKEKLDLELTKDNLKNRIKTLKTNFNTCHEMFKSLSGFSWNSETKIFEAESCVWDELVKAHPTMRKWRTTPIYNYDKLAELFAKDRARGNLAATCDDILDTWNHIDEDVNLQHIEDMVTPTNFSESTPFDGATPPTTKATIDEGTSSTRSTKRKKREAPDDEVELQMFKCMQEISQFMVQSSNDSRRAKEERWEREERREEERRDREERMLQEIREKEERMEQEKREKEERMEQEKREKEARMEQEKREKEERIEQEKRERESWGAQKNQLLFQELQKIGVPEDHILDAYIALANDKHKADIVMGAPEHLRLNALCKVLNNL